MRRGRVIAAAALCLGLAACSDYDLARRAYGAGEYTLAIQRFEALAAAGVKVAIFDLNEEAGEVVAQTMHF